MPKVDLIFLTTTIIKRFLGNDPRGSATGFFFSDSKNNMWLVTNKHVIYGKTYSEEDARPEVNEFSLVIHTNRDDLSQNEEVHIDLFEEDHRIWKEHTRKEIDIICVPLNLDRNKFIFITIGEDLLDSSNLMIGFEKIFVMGYPYGWYDTLNNLPITRIGHLSSPFGAPFQGNPFMLGDVETHEGMSGSPVFMHLKDYATFDKTGRSTRHLGKSKTLLIGVFSGQPLWKIKDKNTGRITNIPHSLSVIWFASLIEEILATQS